MAHPAMDGRLPARQLLRMRVRICCEYPGTDLPPDEVTFVPGRELGTTPEEVHDAVAALLATGGYFELPARDLKTPLPCWAETVREVAVW